MANLLRATKDEALAGKVRRTLTKNFGGTVQASHRASPDEAGEDPALGDCAALTKAERRTLTTIAKQMRRRGHKSQLSGQTASRYTTSVQVGGGTEKLVTEPVIETQS